MATAVSMYCTEWCPYCQMAERLLRARGVSHIEKIRVDLEPGRRVEMVERTGRTSVPQIYIGQVYVGGFDELYALDSGGRLGPLLVATDGEKCNG